MNDEELLRYSRHLLLPGFDVAGQERLLAARVLVVGAGGLGSPVVMYLAAAGVGELWLADDDAVEVSNLQRQIAHGSADCGRNKAESAAAAAHRINPGVQVQVLDRRLQGEDLRQVVTGVDLVLDCSDNFATRFAVNRACVAARRPLVSGAAIRAEGQVAVFDSRRDDSPCYHCLYREDAAEGAGSCSENGVLGPLVGVIGSLQALLALKVLAEFGDAGVGRLLLFDAAVLQWRQLTLPRDPACPVCAAR